MYTRSVEFDTATASLAADGWCVLQGLMSPAQTLALTNECLAMHDARQLTPARVGADRDHTLLRGDSTHWFESDALSAPQQAFADRIDVLRIELSRSLMLGLVDSESHYALYQPGAGYATTMRAWSLRCSISMMHGRKRKVARCGCTLPISRIGISIRMQARCCYFSRRSSNTRFCQPHAIA